MGNIAAVKGALSARLSTIGSPVSGLAVAWEGAAFTPTEGTPYLRTRTLFSGAVQASLGDSGLNQITGIYQVDVVTPLGAGWSVSTGYQDAIISHFKRGTRLTSSGVVVVIKPPYPGPAIEDGAWEFIPVSIPFFSYVQNN